MLICMHRYSLFGRIFEDKVIINLFNIIIMKKTILLLLGFIVSAGAATAQKGLLQFYPNTKGAQLESRSYDAENNHISTMTLTVLDDYEYIDEADIKIAYSMKDAKGDNIDQGLIEASYVGSNFMLDMKNRITSPTIHQYLSMVTTLEGDFFDYPDPFSDGFDYDGPFTMQSGLFNIRSKEDKKKILSVNIYGRELHKTEKIETPAGTFDAAKITFGLELNKDGVKTKYRGVEWYATGAGVVRSEIYDADHKLVDYTVLTSITE